MPDMFQMLKQAKEMQSKLKHVHAELASQTFEGSSAWGAVVATVNGQGQVVNMKLSDEYIKKTPAEIVSSMILKAVSDAQKMASKASEKAMGAVAGPLKGLLG